MATVKVSDLINRAKTIAQDVDFVQWTQAEWLDWYNECLLVLASMRVDALSMAAEIPIDQTTSTFNLPFGSDRLIDVLEYSKTGRIVRKIDRAVLDEQFPYWRDAVSEAGPKYYTYNPDNPKQIHIYPSALDTSHTLKVVVAMTPTSATSIDDVIGVDDYYAPAIVNYMLYRGYLKISEQDEEMARVKFYFDAFRKMIGGGEGE
ncbi:TPA: DUF6682 family protein [Pasteurella multocida]